MCIKHRVMLYCAAKKTECVLQHSGLSLNLVHPILKLFQPSLPMSKWDLGTRDKKRAIWPSDKYLKGRSKLPRLLSAWYHKFNLLVALTRGFWITGHVEWAFSKPVSVFSSKYHLSVRLNTSLIIYNVRS